MTGTPARDKQKERIARDVEHWKAGKAIHKLLNDVNGLKTPDKGALRRFVA